MIITHTTSAAALFYNFHHISLMWWKSILYPDINPNLSRSNDCCFKLWLTQRKKKKTNQRMLDTPSQNINIQKLRDKYRHRISLQHIFFHAALLLWKLQSYFYKHLILFSALYSHVFCTSMPHLPTVFFMFLPSVLYSAVSSVQVKSFRDQSVTSFGRTKQASLF